MSEGFDFDLIGGGSSGGGGSRSGGISSRLGEIVMLVGSVDAPEGLIPIKAGSVENGALDNPDLVKKQPRLIDPNNSNNIFFSQNVVDVIFANVSGDALNEWTHREDSTAVNGLSVLSSGTNIFSNTDSSGSNNYMLPKYLSGGSWIDVGDPDGLEGDIAAVLDDMYINPEATHSHGLSGNSETTSDRYLVQYYIVGDKYADVLKTVTTITSVTDTLTSDSITDALSAAQGKELDNKKVDKVTGKGLSDENFTAESLEKLESIIDKDYYRARAKHNNSENIDFSKDAKSRGITCVNKVYTINKEGVYKITIHEGLMSSSGNGVIYIDPTGDAETGTYLQHYVDTIQQIRDTYRVKVPAQGATWARTVIEIPLIAFMAGAQFKLTAEGIGGSGLDGGNFGYVTIQEL